ncbi:hypothetical protein GGI25_005704 [Coemansia spiralis]|uniref:Uncharacterized protein n=2 Tax=Coemansia TaxID=4863 RepID=A0A9W8G475_9FUNG|nr:hypothetical protein EDC05_005462 [Coemansia umbellata]KAJ2625568.1 hypothetical protein GGI26_000367 [Coemansia sp. RSA 1358]KAJ2670826.1 hypothetical protein GGI25_005704 [Coemansia spiralis]
MSRPMALMLVLIQLFIALMELTSVSAEISSVILPLASTVWVSGSSAAITYRVSDSVGDDPYEIDLMSGDPNNAQLVYVFEQTAKPTALGVNSVTVKVPTTLPEGKYGIRIGPAVGSSWKYSQIFTISNNADTSGSSESESNSHDQDPANTDSDIESSHTSHSTNSSDESSEPQHTADSSTVEHDPAYMHSTKISASAATRSALLVAHFTFYLVIIFLLI